ncbi:MAG: hypothetical protein LBV37_01715 [Mycoplasmataceae bacterium]|nr:hypothetical protein [Mycoplasmataceae bacterium]
MSSSVILDLIKHPEKINKTKSTVYKTIGASVEADLAKKFKLLCKKLNTTSNDVILTHIKADIETYESLKGEIKI